MSIPDRIKEDVRAVLLSKTDGKGVLVSSFLRDYKAMLHEPLMFKDLGFSTLQDFLKAIPEICRLEFSDKDMAYRLYGISKPNTYVSSFTKRAEGNEVRDTKSRDKQEREAVTKSLGTGLDEDWQPNFQGYFTVCFHNKKARNLDSREEVAKQFAKVGEVVDINITNQLTFVRYADQENAKTAIRIWGDTLGLRRADEKVKRNGKTFKQSHSKSDSKQNMMNGDSIKDNSPLEKSIIDEPVRKERIHENGNRDIRECGEREVREDRMDNHRTRDNQESHSISLHAENREEYHSTNRESHHRSVYEESRVVHQTPENRESHQKVPPLARDTEMTKEERGDRNGPYQVYIGNWPNEATLEDLEDILQGSNHLDCRINSSKDNFAKRFVFVDYRTMTEAQRIIDQLNGQRFMSRDLIARMGKGTKKGSSNSHKEKEDHQTSKGSIEDEFERLCVHRGREQQAAKLSPLPQLSPLSRTITNNSSKGKQETDTRSSASSNSPSKMPPLEQMPELETSMPELEPLSPQKMPNSLKGMPELEPISPQKIPQPLTNKSYLDNMNNNNNITKGLNDMPALEPLAQRSPALSTKSSIRSSDYIQVFVGNFPYGTKDWELSMLLEPYGGHTIAVKNRSDANRSTYAFASFDDIQQAEVAITNLDQSVFKGRRLTMAMASVYESSSQASSNDLALNSGPLARITCTVGGNNERMVSVGDEYKLTSDQYNSTTSHMAHDNRSSVSSNMSGPLYMANRRDDNFNFRKFTMIVKDYSLIVTKLRGEDEFNFNRGQKLRVLVTHVENERFFWGQILVDSVKGVSTNLKTLQTLQTDLQTAERTKNLKGMGRCMAMFQGEWYRGWCIHFAYKDNDMIGDIFYVDYGNSAMVPMSQVFYTQAQAWIIPPMAKPFKIQEPVCQMKSLENQVVTVEVTEPGNSFNNFLTTAFLDL